MRLDFQQNKANVSALDSKTKNLLAEDKGMLKLKSIKRPIASSKLAEAIRVFLALRSR
jgi:hypothetical protein